MNEPGTWELLEKVRELADKFGLELFTGDSCTMQMVFMKRLQRKEYDI